MSRKKKQLQFANWFAEKLEKDEDFLKRLHITDECHVYLSRVVNKQNFRYRKTENPGDVSTETVGESILQVTMCVVVE